MRPSESREPDEQARIGGAEANSLFGKRDRFLWSTLIKVHLAEENMRRCKTGIELYRLPECLDCAIGAARPHTYEAEAKPGVRVAPIESDRALRQLVRLDVAVFHIFCPAEVSRIAHCDRERRRCLTILRICDECAPEIVLRLDVVVLAVPVMVPHSTLIEFVGILIVLWLVRDPVTLEF